MEVKQNMKKADWKKTHVNMMAAIKVTSPIVWITFEFG